MLLARREKRLDGLLVDPGRKRVREMGKNSESKGDKTIRHSFNIFNMIFLQESRAKEPWQQVFKRSEKGCYIMIYGSLPGGLGHRVLFD